MCSVILATSKLQTASALTTPSTKFRCATLSLLTPVHPDWPAAVYSASEGLEVLVLETGSPGQAGSSSRIENYLGFPTGIKQN